MINEFIINNYVDIAWLAMYLLFVYMISMIILSLTGLKMQWIETVEAISIGSCIFLLLYGLCLMVEKAL